MFDILQDLTIKRQDILIDESFPWGGGALLVTWLFIPKLQNAVIEVWEWIIRIHYTFMW